MMSRLILFVALLVAVAQAFTVAPPAKLDFALLGCRTNAKKEKRQRNRENMRKFKTGGRKGVSRRKLIKKALSSKAREEEAEFISKCFITVPMEEENNNA